MNVNDLFPLTVNITHEIIAQADVWSTSNCIGALALKKGLKGKIDENTSRIGWGREIGYSRINGVPVGLGTRGIDLMKVTEPRKVTFYLEDVLEEAL